MSVVSNSSPILALAAIERLSLFPDLFDTILIPAAVAVEIKPSLPERPSWLRLETLTRPMPEFVLRRSLGQGERETVALAVEREADPVILDDLPARRVARASGLSVVGTVGLLLAAKRRGLIGLIRPELDNLLEKSFFLSPQLYDELLRAAGEAED